MNDSFGIINTDKIKRCKNTIYFVFVVVVVEEIWLKCGILLSIEEMVDERTSLFANSRAETSYAVPGRFTRSKPDRFNRLQFCIWTSFLWDKFFWDKNCFENTIVSDWRWWIHVTHYLSLLCVLYFIYFFACRAAFILALVITIAVVVTRDSDDDSNDEQSRTDNPGRIVNRNEFSTLMQSFDGPISGE